jgi:glycosyltransferase involved in cell wall biosynthesis
VVVLPPIAHAEIPALLGAAHIGVTSLPTVDNLKYQASSPVKIFEYMAAGMPILSTANPCHTDVVGDGTFAFWAASPAEAELLRTLQTLWAVRLQLAQKGGAAAAAAEAWSWRAAAKKLKRALENGLAMRTASRSSRRQAVIAASPKRQDKSQ